MTSNTELFDRIENNSVTERTLPWGRIGTVFSEDDRPTTADAALKAANLDWDVELVPMGWKNNGSFRVVPGNFVTVRRDTDEPLGTVKSRYKLFQNRDAFAFADDLAHGGGIFEAGWEYKGGKEVGLTMRFGDDILIGGEDPHGTYLLLRNSHDGSTSIQMAICTMRMSCMNQAASNIRGAKSRWSVVHSSSVKGRLQEAREALAITVAYQEAFKVEMEELMAKELGEKAIDRFLDSVLTEARVSDKVKDRDTTAIRSLLRNSSTIQDDQRTTAYGLELATTEYFDHYRDYRTDQAAYASTAHGIGARVRTNLHEALVTA